MAYFFQSWLAWFLLTYVADAMSTRCRCGEPKVTFKGVLAFSFSIAVISSIVMVVLP